MPFNQCRILNVQLCGVRAVGQVAVGGGEYIPCPVSSSIHGGCALYLTVVSTSNHALCSWLM